MFADRNARGGSTRYDSVEWFPVLMPHVNDIKTGDPFLPISFYCVWHKAETLLCTFTYSFFPGKRSYMRTAVCCMCRCQRDSSVPLSAVR